MARINIYSLPNEMLYLVASYLSMLALPVDLANLSLVSQRWRPVAQEALLTRPRFDISHVEHYLRQIHAHTHLLPRIRTLEIRSHSARNVIHNKYGHPLHQTQLSSDAAFSQEKLLEVCAETIDRFSPRGHYKRRWTAALGSGYMSAFLGVLICILPNLRELKCGNVKLADFALFGLLRRYGVSVRPEARESHRYLLAPLKKTFEQLEVLELPANITGLSFASIGSTLFDFRQFGKLKELGISHRPLCWFPQTGKPSIDPQYILPSTLEVLKISEAAYDVAHFVSRLCQAKQRNHFPALRRVEVYFMNSLCDNTKQIKMHQCLDPTKHLPPKCAEAEIELYLYFPGTLLQTWEIGGTPWQFRQAGYEQLIWAEIVSWYGTKHPSLASLSYGIEKLVCEMQWDSDGDVVMG